MAWGKERGRRRLGALFVPLLEEAHLGSRKRKRSRAYLPRFPFRRFLLRLLGHRRHHHYVSGDEEGWGEIIGRGSLGLLPALPPPLEFRNISSVFPAKTIRNQAVLPASRVAFLIVRACVVSGEARNDYSRVSARGSH